MEAVPNPVEIIKTKSGDLLYVYHDERPQYPYGDRDESNELVNDESCDSLSNEINSKTYNYE